MIEINVIIKAPAEIVWQILTDTEQWPEWGPSVADVRSDDRFIQSGSTGYVRTIFGLWLPFKVTQFVHAKKWSWRVCRIPATGHCVEPISQNQCRLIFEVPVFMTPYLFVCAIAARRIRQIAEQR